jgi:hypothetical protein
MEKYAILLGYFNKQLGFVERLYEELISVDLSIYEKRFLFAMRVQQFYTAIEDLLKQIAKSFENHIDQMSSFHKELLARMNTEVPQIRPAVISHQSFLFLDKLRAFRHFVRHAYDCELDEKELLLIQNKLRNEFQSVKADLEKFKSFIRNLSHA